MCVCVCVCERERSMRSVEWIVSQTGPPSVSLQQHSLPRCLHKHTHSHTHIQYMHATTLQYTEELYMHTYTEKWFNATLSLTCSWHAIRAVPTAHTHQYTTKAHYQYRLYICVCVCVSLCVSASECWHEYVIASIYNICLCELNLQDCMRAYV